MRRRSLGSRRVLLTGAAGGVGGALAQRLAGRGASLVLTDVRAEALREAVGALPPGAVADALAADLTAARDRADLAARATELGVDLVIHNAGIAPGGRFATQPEATIDAVLEVNLRAVVQLTRALLPGLLAQPRPALSFVASGAGLLAPAGLAAYAASKAGLVAFALALRAEHRGRLGVSVVCPAFVRTGIISHTADLAGEPVSPGLDALVQRAGVSPDRVARAVLRGIVRDRRCVVVGAVPRALLATHAVAPGLTERASHALFHTLLRRGALS